MSSFKQIIIVLLFLVSFWHQKVDYGIGVCSAWYAG